MKRTIIILTVCLSFLLTVPAYAIQPRLLSVSEVDGHTIEKYEVEYEAYYIENENGQLVFCNTQNSRSTHEESDTLGPAIKWKGRLIYYRTTINGLPCISPNSFSHCLTVPNGYVVTKLSATGGASGLGFHTNKDNARGVYTLGPVTLSKTNPNSGQYYAKSLSNPGYAIFETELVFNTRGSFKYYKTSDSQHTEYTVSIPQVDF